MQHQPFPVQLSKYLLYATFWPCLAAGPPRLEFQGHRDRKMAGGDGWSSGDDGWGDTVPSQPPAGMLITQWTLYTGSYINEQEIC